MASVDRGVRSGRDGWLVVSLGWLVAVVASDVLLDRGRPGHVVLIGLLIGGPLLASLRLDASRTALVGAATAVAGLVLARVNHLPHNADLGTRAAALSFACGFAVIAARRRTIALQLAEEQRCAARRATLLASTLQASLLPPALPAAPGLELAARYEPADADMLVGGDFYDCFPLGDGEWVAVLGDVQGKGVEAATVAGLIQNSLRTICLQERSPARMLHALNALLVRRRGRFCTLALVKLRPLPDGQVEGTVALGGHDHPLVRRAGGGVERIGHTGTLIGAVEDIVVRDCEFRLAPADALLLFSDGVAPYGDESLCRALAEPADAQGVCARVDAGGATDDVTLLCVRAV